MEYELIDTGVFDDDRYFDVFVEYAKASPEDILVLLTVANRGPEPADAPRAPDALVPQHVVVGRREPRSSGCGGCEGPRGVSVVGASHAELGERYLYCDEDAPLLFTENETNNERISGDAEREPVGQGRHQQLRRARPDGCGEPGRRPAPRPPPTTGSPWAPARARRSGCA